MAKKKDGSAGRPTSFKEEYCEQARKLCLLGYTDVQLADFFNVCEATINNWKIEYPLFLESLRKGKDIADAEVVSSFYRKATGFKEKETKVFCHEGCIITEDVDKYYPPDTAAAFIWLKNRQGGKWKDKTETESDNKLEIKLNYNLED